MRRLMSKDIKIGDEVKITNSNGFDGTYYSFIIAKPKKFFWLRKLFRFEAYITEGMFSEEKEPKLPKGFTKFKLIGSVKNV